MKEACAGTALAVSPLDMATANRPSRARHSLRRIALPGALLVGGLLGSPTHVWAQG